MAGARALRVAREDDPSRHLYQRIGNFLFDQRLAPDPANYAFAYHLLGEPDGPLARLVAAMTEGGIRLTQRDIESLGCEPPAARAPVDAARTEELVARTQMQVEGFADMVQAIRDETEDFGRDLAASAAAINRSRGGGNGDTLDDLARITATMLDRVRTAESRLESATCEADELRRKLEEARDNALRDPLTNLPNRRAFEEAYAAQSATGTRICIAVCDVDHFKSVNDRFGHAVGDRVLRAIGEALSEACKGYLVARYGGEEFAVLFPGIDVEAARATLEAARIKVAAKRYRLRESDAPLGEVTFSAGLTAAVPDETYQKIFQRADALLYKAKTDGRNRVRLG